MDTDLRTVDDAMVPLSPEIAVAPDDGMIEALQKLNASRLGRVLVTHDGRLVGLIAQSDIARWLERTRVREEVIGSRSH